MKIKILNETLNKVLPYINKGLSQNPSITSLKGILIIAKQTSLEFFASDGIFSIKAKLEISANLEINELGKILVPGKTFIDIVKKNKGIIKIELIEKELNISSDNSDFKIKTYDPEDYPNIDFSMNDKDAIKLNGYDLKRIKDEVSYAAAENDRRIILNGLNIKIINNVLISIATNSSRLSMKKIKTNSNNDFNITIFPKSFAEFIPNNLNEEIELFIDDNKINVRKNNIIMQSRLIDGIYPDIEKLIPSTFEQIIEVDSRELIDAIDSASIVNSGLASPIKISKNSDNSILIESKKDQIGDSKIILPIIKWEGKDSSIVLNSKFMKDALECLEGTIFLKFNGPHNAILVHSEKKEDLIQLILPYRAF